MGDWVGDGVALGGGDKKFQSSRFQKKGQVRPHEKSQLAKKTPITHMGFELKFPKFRTSNRIFFHLKT